MGPLVTWYHRPGASDVVGSSALVLPRMADCIRLWWSDRRRATERVDKKRPIVTENAATVVTPDSGSAGLPNKEGNTEFLTSKMYVREQDGLPWPS